MQRLHSHYRPQLVSNYNVDTFTDCGVNVELISILRHCGHCWKINQQIHEGNIGLR